MNALSKTTFAFLCLAICLVINGAEIKNKSLLNSLGDSPQDFKKLSAAAQAHMLCSIAEDSYKILIKVPQKGLRESHESLEQIISARKWLEKTDDVVARTLAVDLQYGVDSAILNEMYREGKKKHSRSLRHAFKSDSFNNTLVEILLQKNTIDEHEYISYALNLDTEIAKFCKDNYDANDFLSGRVFQEARDQMVISLSATRNGEKIQILENVDVRQANLMFTMAWTGFRTNSKREIARFFLSKVLRAIDQARDVRLLSHIYQKYGGFAESVKAETPILESDSFLGRLTAEVAKTDERRLTDHEGTSNYSDKLKAILISGRMEGRVDVDDGDVERSEYEHFLAHNMVLFIRDPNVFSSERFANSASKIGFLGMWLELEE